MVEPITTGLAAGSVALYLTKRTIDGLTRLCGPAADAIAEALGRFATQRLRNVGRVVEIAESRTDTTVDGSIPMRVAIRMLREAADSDDPLIHEYIGGVLASSRTPLGRDDRGAVLTHLVSRLATYHLRTHYIFYTELRRVLAGKEFNLLDVNEVNATGTVFVPEAVYLPALDLDPTEDFESIAMSSLFTLQRENLIGLDRGGSIEYLNRSGRGFPEAGFQIRPTVMGSELYLWALGRGQVSPLDLFDPELDLPKIDDIEISPRSILVTDIPFTWEIPLAD